MKNTLQIYDIFANTQVMQSDNLQILTLFKLFPTPFNIFLH